LTAESIPVTSKIPVRAAIDLRLRERELGNDWEVVLLWPIPRKYVSSPGDNADVIAGAAAHV
jgi:hypothetical protein